jgi:hypothetical protein
MPGTDCRRIVSQRVPTPSPSEAPAIAFASSSLSPSRRSSEICLVGCGGRGRGWKGRRPDRVRGRASLGSLFRDSGYRRDAFSLKRLPLGSFAHPSRTALDDGCNWFAHDLGPKSATFRVMRSRLLRLRAARYSRSRRSPRDKAAEDNLQLAPDNRPLTFGAVRARIATSADCT